MRRVLSLFSPRVKRDNEARLIPVPHEGCAQRGPSAPCSSLLFPFHCWWSVPALLIIPVSLLVEKGLLLGPAPCSRFTVGQCSALLLSRFTVGQRCRTGAHTARCCSLPRPRAACSS